MLLDNEYEPQTKLLGEDLILKLSFHTQQNLISFQILDLHSSDTITNICCVAGRLRCGINKCK